MGSSSAAPAAISPAASPSSLQNNAGSSGPSATRAAPVKVAASTSIAGCSVQASASASHRMSRPSASVLPISTVMPFLVLTISSGRIALPLTAFSTSGNSTRNRTGNPPCMSACASPSMIAAPPMSFFIIFMPEAGFRSSPPESKHTPLPTNVTFGARSSPQRISTRRGWRLLARPTAWIVG